MFPLGHKSTWPRTSVKTPEPYFPSKACVGSSLPSNSMTCFKMSGNSCFPGDTPIKKEMESEETSGAKESRKIPGKEPLEEPITHIPASTISRARASAQAPRRATWDQGTVALSGPGPGPVEAQRRHVCADCGRRFTYPSLLVSHRRMHSGERPFPCPECGMRFKRKFAVEAHQWIHRSCSGGRRGRRPGIRAVPGAPVRGDQDPPVLFRHYPDIFEECG